MSLKDALNAKGSPTFTASVGETLEFNGLIGTDPKPNKEALAPIFERFGLDPDDWELSGRLTVKSWDAYAPGGGFVPAFSYGGSFIPRNPHAPTDEEVTQLLALAKADPASQHPNSNTPPQHPNPRPQHPTRVVIVSDPQIGKVDERGGTRELIERTTRLCRRLRQTFEEEPAGTIIHIDGGDIAEGFENTAGQAYSNDLSHPAQLRFARKWLTTILSLEVEYTDDHHVLATTSNHTAWRKGRDYLGKPGDDYGLDVHYAVRDVFEASGKPTVWHLPDPWREYTTANINSVGFALTHGHRAKGKNGVMDWWKGQLFAHPEDFKDIMFWINAHWHSAFFNQVGFGQYQIQAGAMDGGSNWFTNTTGYQAEPCVVTFRVTEDRILRDFQVIPLV